ncbi:MAG: hypothetical protein GEU81_18255 [Nitriliruptorales bacterium]|nr:hypothetical protein [Nitriliruptorales bacterium]
MAAQHRFRPGYVAAGIVLMVFGFISIFTIGVPILVAGVIVLVAGLTDAHRRRPRVFWPVVAAIAALFVGYVLVAPLSCTSQAVVRESGEDVGATSCTNLVGIDYSGGLGYNPPLWPAVAVGGGGAALAGAATRRSMSSDRGR